MQSASFVPQKYGYLNQSQTTDPFSLSTLPGDASGPIVPAHILPA